MAFHQSVPITTQTQSDRRRIRFRPVLIVLLATTISVGVVTSHTSLTTATGVSLSVADGASSAIPGPCWGCH